MMTEEDLVSAKLTVGAAKPEPDCGPEMVASAGRSEWPISGVDFAGIVVKVGFRPKLEGCCLSGGATRDAATFDDLTCEAVEHRGEDRVQIVGAGSERSNTIPTGIPSDVAEAGLDNPRDLDEESAFGDLAVTLTPGRFPETA